MNPNKEYTYTLYGDILGNEANDDDYKNLESFLEDSSKDGVKVYVINRTRTIGATPNPFSDIEGMDEDDAADHFEGLLNDWYESLNAANA